MEIKEKKNTYKTLGELAVRLNEESIFEKRYVSVKDIINVFEKAHLFYFNKENNRYEPTDFMKDSNGCFLTKSGKILFTEPMFKLMTENTKDYKHKTWVKWFIDTFKSEKPLRKPTLDDLILKQYIVAFDNSKYYIVKGYNSKRVKEKMGLKYGKKVSSHLHCL